MSRRRFGIESHSQNESKNEVSRRVFLRANPLVCQSTESQLVSAKTSTTTRLVENIVLQTRLINSHQIDFFLIFSLSLRPPDCPSIYSAHPIVDVDALTKLSRKLLTKWGEVNYLPLNWIFVFCRQLFSTVIPILPEGLPPISVSSSPPRQGTNLPGVKLCLRKILWTFSGFTYLQ